MFGWEKKMKGKIVGRKMVKGKKVKGKWEDFLWLFRMSESK